MPALADYPALNLFDKFIHIEFEEYMTQAEALKIYELEEGLRGATERNRLIGSGGDSASLVRKNPTEAEWTAFVDQHTGKVRIDTPPTGMKPHIAVNAAFIPNLRTTQVSVAIKNLEFSVNINTFAYMRVRMGYFNGPAVMFRGAIINSYIENPNPNGNTVFQLLDTGILGDLVSPVDAYLAFHGKTTWLGALATACAQLGLILDREAVSAEYDRVPLMNARKTVKFATPLALLNFFREAGQRAFEALGLNAPEVILAQEKVLVAIIGDAQKVEYNVPALDQIKTASFTGGGLMVKAPFNPAVVPLKCFYINPAYFRGRFNAQNIRASQNRLIAGQTGVVTSIAGGANGARLVEDKGLGVAEDGYYQCIQLNVQFDTYAVNEMQVTGIMANATQDNSQALREAIDKYQGEKLDGYFIEYPPEAYPAFWEQGEGSEQERPQELVVSERSGEPHEPSEGNTGTSGGNTGTGGGNAGTGGGSASVGSGSGYQTLPYILDHYLNKAFVSSGGYQIEFKIGGMAHPNARAGSPNHGFANYFGSGAGGWFGIHGFLKSGFRNDDNIYGSAAKDCIKGLQQRVLDIQKRVRSFTILNGVEGVLYMLYQRKWFNAHKDDARYKEILPSLSAYILNGEKIGDTVFNEHPGTYNNDSMTLAVVNGLHERERTMHIQGPDWAACIKYDVDLLSLLAELVAWAGRNARYSFCITLFQSLSDNIKLLKGVDV